MGRREMTDRVVAAVEHPYIDAIGHPTGRKIETRAPYEIDMERVIEAAALTGTMIEVNATPDRRDMNEIHAREAARAGVRVLVNSDAHSLRNFELLRYGIATARRAWLTAGDVANTRSWAEFAPLRKARPARRGTQVRPAEARRAHEPDRLHGRRAVDVEASRVALLDRLHGGVLAAPRDDPDHRAPAATAATWGR